MDYRCPLCHADLGRRKVTQAIITRMEMECPHCRTVVRMTVHRAEEVIVAVSFGAILLLAALAYRFQSEGLVLVAFGAAMAGSLALPVLERTWLRTWRRYKRIPPDAGG
jgi:DNA-directed RNA polymerase subunit RPC12/RpoP